jgi:predicted enzyme related to lactoylglutathione lyase
MPADTVRSVLRQMLTALDFLHQKNKVHGAVRPSNILINEHGTLTWTECQTPDVPAAAKFYGELFGWTTEEMDMGPEGAYTIFNLDAEGVAGAMNPPMDGIPPHWAIVFAVDDCEGCVATARTEGGTILLEPMDIPVGRQAVIADPQGAVFGVIKLAEPPTN